MRILVPVDGFGNAFRALEYAISTRDLYRDPIEIHLLNVQRPVLSGNVRAFISQEQLHSYYQDEGTAALKAACERPGGSGVAHGAHVAIGEGARQHQPVRRATRLQADYHGDAWHGKHRQLTARPRRDKGRSLSADPGDSGQVAPVRGLRANSSREASRAKTSLFYRRHREYARIFKQAPTRFRVLHAAVKLLPAPGTIHPGGGSSR